MSILIIHDPETQSRCQFHYLQTKCCLVRNISNIEINECDLRASSSHVLNHLLYILFTQISSFSSVVGSEEERAVRPNFFIVQKLLVWKGCPVSHTQAYGIPAFLFIRIYSIRILRLKFGQNILPISKNNRLERRLTVVNDSLHHGMQFQAISEGVKEENLRN